MIDDIDMEKEHGPWENYQTETEHGPWEKYQGKRYQPVINYKRLKESFNPDGNHTLSFIDDDSMRTNFNFQCAKLGDGADEERKRWALSAYFSLNSKADINYCYENLDGLLEEYYGKKTDAKSAFKDVSDMYYPSSGVWNAARNDAGTGIEHLDALLSGMVSFSSIAASTSVKLMNWQRELLYLPLKPFLPEGNFIEQNLNISEEIGKKIKKAGEEYSGDLDRASNSNPDFILDMIKGDFDNVSVFDFTKGLVRSLPDMGFQIGVAAVAPYLLPVLVGTQTAAQKDYEVNEKNPEWNFLKKWSYIGLSTVNEALLEIVTSKIAGGKMTVKEGGKIISRGLMKYIAGSMAKEGGTEAVQQLDQNVIDYLYDVENNREILSGAEKFDRIFRGVLESGAIGAVYGGPGGIVGYKNTKEFMGIVEEKRNFHKSRIDELSKKENLTADEMNQLNTSRKLVEIQDPNQLLAADHVSQVVEEVNQHDQIVNSDEYKSFEEDAAAGSTQESLIEAVKAERNQEISRAAAWTPQMVIDRVTEYSNTFRNTVFNVVKDWNQLRGRYNPEELPGRSFIDFNTGEIYINASKVRPEDVLEVMLHEVIGHKGLRAVVPENQLDTFLDQVYQEHFSDEDFLNIAGRYFPEKVQNIADEDVEYSAVVLEDVQDQRLAAEEYIAYLAQRGVQKPSWWKEFLQKIRMWWSGTVWGKDFIPTNEQIETLLARSSRKMKKRWYNRGSQVVTDGFADGKNGDLRFSIIGEKGALGLDGFLMQNNLDNLNKAKEMLLSGKDEKNIKLATGWEKGADGKWRMEIPDLTMKTERIYGNIREIVEAPVYFDGPLEYYVSAPELFAAYPSLRNIKVRMADLSIGSGQYSDRTNTITIDRNSAFSERDQRRVNELHNTIQRAKNWGEKDRKNAEILGIETNPEIIIEKAEKELSEITQRQLYWYRDILIHEVQHAIQHIEGFAYGSSPEYFEQNPFVDEEVKEEYEKAVQNEYKLKKELLDDHPEFHEDFNRWFELDKVYESDSQIDEQAIFDEMDRIDQRFRDAGLGDIWDKYNFAYREYIAAKRNLKSGIPPLTAYWRTAGEVEARNAQKRRNMTGEEKRKILLSETEDVAEESKIYLFGIENSAMAEPFTENQKKKILSMVPKNGADVIKKILYGGTITRNANTVNFDGKNSHALKLHLDAPGFKPSKGPVTFEEIEKYLPLALAQKPVVKTKKNKKGKKKKNKIYKFNENGITYTLVTSSKGYFRSFYSNKKVNKRRKFALQGASATGMLTMHNLSQHFENSSVEMKKNEKLRNVSDDIRFSLSDFSVEDERDYVSILKPYVGSVIEKSGSEYRQYLEKHGVQVTDDQAWYLAQIAKNENMKLARERGKRKREDWLRANFPLYKAITEIAGDNFLIKPSYRFQGENFTGSWISPEFVKYSEKRQQGKKESNGSYLKYQDRREKNLKNAKGYDSDELAEGVARLLGKDPLEVEQEIIDFFRDLKKRDFYANYTRFREDSAYEDEYYRKRAMEEFMEQERFRIEEEVIDIITHGAVITPEWVTENRAVYNELYQQIFKGKKAPYTPGKKDIEAINAALAQSAGDASLYAQAYKDAKEQAWKEYQKRLTELRENVMESRADAVKLQREALKFAEENLPAEYRSEFVRSVVSLLDYSTSPSNKYPEGRRMHEFRNIQSRIIRRSAQVRKDSGIAAIREMLDSAKIKRNYKGIPTSVLPSEQRRVDRIRSAVNMNLATVTNAIEYNNQKIMELEGNEEVEDLMYHFLEDNRLLEIFGNLDNRSADDVDAAAKILENIIKGGKAKFKDAITRRKVEVDAMRKRAVDDATFGRNEYKDRGDAQKHSNYFLKNESLGTLMRIVSGKSIQDFDNSVAGELYRKVEDSTQKEQTNLRHMQEDMDAALRDIAGITGNRLQALRKKGKFFRMISEEVENTGVFKTEYSRPIKTGKVDFVFEHGRRALQKRAIPVEDYEWNGKMRSGARSILQKIDNGEKVAFYQDMILDDAAVSFLRQQLADFDAGLKQSYEFFNDESDDANFNRMLEEERQEGKLIVFSHDPNEISNTVEVPLSQGAALQILLTWEQEHYQPNMKWNGWTEKSIEQLKKFIKPEVLKMGYWMRDQISKNKAALDAKVFERYGAHLPLNENYFPAAFRGGKTKSIQVDSELGRGAGSMSINPNFLIARKFHLKPVDTDADAFTSFLSNQIEQGHFLAWSDAVRDLKAVYGATMVQKSIADNFGKAVVSNLVERVATIARGGQFSGDYAARFMSKFYRHWVPAKIAINPSSVIKQMIGTSAYMNHVPVKDFVSYFAKANFSNPDYRAFVQWAKNTDYMKNRMDGGLDKDLSYLLNYTRDSKAYSPFSDALLNIGTYFTRWADAWSALHGGYAAYMYALDQARKAGYPEGEAHEAARRAWMRSTDETQQSGFLKDQNYFQSNQGAFRYLTAFMSNPIQTMNLQLQTINEIRYGYDKKAAWKKLGRQILVNHLIVPTLMQFTTDMLRYGFNVADWWDEAEFEDYFLAWMLGSFESVFLFGQLMKGIGDYTLDRVIGRKMSFSDSISALPLADDLQRDVGLFVKLAYGEKELTEKELMDAVKAIGDFGMAIGVFQPKYGAVGAIIHAVGAQGKRIARWFEDEK